MSDLTRFRDHARAMSKAEHTPDCEAAAAKAKNRWHHWCLFGEWPEHWGKRPKGQPARCPGGCMSESDRELWTRLADEADAYLNRDVQDALIP